MIHYSVEKWMRVGLGVMAFAMALLLTPRAFLDVTDVTDHADSYEVPVDMLEPSDECLWCSPAFEAKEKCDDLDRHWLNPDQIRPEDLNAPCRDDASDRNPMASEEPSA